MKILLISANKYKIPDPVPPLGLAFIAASLKKNNHEYQLIDLNFEHDLDNKFKETSINFNPELIVLSLRNIDNCAYPHGFSFIPEYIELCKKCRKFFKNSILTVGGSGFSICPEEMMKLLDADIGLVGEGEETIIECLKHFEEGGTLQNCPKLYYPNKRQDKIISFDVDYSVLDVDKYYHEGGMLNLQSKRGCSFTCSFCTYPNIEGKKVRIRPPQKVVDDIELCVKEYNVKHYFIVDSVFNYPEEHSTDIAKEIIKRGLNISWTAYATPKFSNEHTLTLYKESGCSSLDFGTDAFNDAMLKSLHKSFTTQDVFLTCSWCKKNEIKFNHSLMFGGIGETENSIEETIENTESTNPNFITAMTGIRIYPNTAIADELINKGWAKTEDISINPIYYIEPNIHDYLLNRLGDLAKNNRRWFLPASPSENEQKLLNYLRAKKHKGLLWELL